MIPKEYSALENELLRLEKLKEFISLKLPLKLQYPQTKVLVEDEKKRHEELKTKVIEKISNPNSLFNQNIQDIFDTIFFL